jgi:DHA1 family bicyclomycin/chloramphenicol resistance-like MFS transporter
VRPGSREGRRTFEPGTAAFTITISMATALTALGIDTLLPAFPEIREALDLPADSTQVATLVTIFLLGQGLGVLPAGLLADRFGRRPVLWGGLAIYILGAIAATFAPTIELMILARLLWGVGAAGPRVATTAMIRDAYEGTEMARQMSLIMAVFLVVPTIAPAIGTALLAVGPWQLVYLICAVAALAVLAASFRLPATMPVDARRKISMREVGGSIWTVLSTPGSAGYLISLTALFGSFMAYLGSSEIIIDEIFGLSDWFAVIFGGVAMVMAFGMLMNGRIVGRIGLVSTLKVVMAALLVANAVAIAAAVLTEGTPSLLVYLLALTPVIVFVQMLGPNINAAFMQPLGHVAGVAAAVIAMVPMVGGALLGNVINDAYDGTITPMVIGFAVAAVITAGTLAWSHNARLSSISAARAEPTSELSGVAGD